MRHRGLPSIRGTLLAVPRLHGAHSGMLRPMFPAPPNRRARLMHLGAGLGEAPSGPTPPAFPPRLVFGAPGVPFAAAKLVRPGAQPYVYVDETTSPANAPRPVWEGSDLFPASPSEEGAPFGPGLEGDAEDLEQLRQRASAATGRDIPTESELRARLGPTFDLSRYRSSLERLVQLSAGYPLRDPSTGAVVVSPNVPSTSGRSLLDNADDLLKKIGQNVLVAGVVLGALYIFTTMGRRR